ncbi:hypothetical protein [Nostoc cycadae]|uniref:hypothetical protein n=1 Tax=Nostoc cycadae TaxID=246795 RepID=UPI0011AEEB3B|nr:hypothetical protein [Nostoc cycadae]
MFSKSSKKRVYLLALIAEELLSKCEYRNSLYLSTLTSDRTSFYNLAGAIALKTPSFQLKTRHFE